MAFEVTKARKGTTRRFLPALPWATTPHPEVSSNSVSIDCHALLVKRGVPEITSRPLRPGARI